MRDHIRFTDLVLDDIADTLAAYEPERGGALLAAGGLVHHLVEDVDGRYTRTEWRISTELTGHVQAAETDGRGVLAGTVHTHPSSTPDPSPPDLAATAKLLEENAHIEQAVIGVVTLGEPRDRDLPIGQSHRMSVHIARRAAGARVRVSRASASVVPIGADMRRTQAPNPSRGFDLMWHGTQRLAVPLDEDDRSLLLLVPRDYPTSGPIVVDATEEGVLTPLDDQSWDPSRPSHQQLAQLLRRAYRRRPEGFGDRIEGLAGQLASKRVLVAGAGSVGSWIIEELTRAGVGHLDIIDPDHVTASNLTRTTYESEHLGLAKVDAAAQLCARINPAITTTGHQSSIGELEGDLNDLCERADLIVAATDDPTEQALLGHHAYAAGTPLVACALYRRAQAGEVVLVVPGIGTPCWVCATGARDNGATGDKDYGTGRLVGELALGPSIHLVAEVAAGAAIGLLAGPDTPAGAPVKDLLVSQRTLGLVSTTPDWDFFPTVFNGLEGHQWAPQSIWARVRSNTGCPVCSTTRTSPITDAGKRIKRLMRTRRSMTVEDRAGSPAALDQEIQQAPM